MVATSHAIDFCVRVQRPGFEKMERGSLGSKFTDRTNPMEKHVGSMFELREMTAAPMAPQMFGNAGVEHMEKYGTPCSQMEPRVLCCAVLCCTTRCCHMCGDEVGLLLALAGSGGCGAVQARSESTL